MIAALAFACIAGAHVTVSGQARGAPYVLLWTNEQNLVEYDAGKWPVPSQILRRSVVADNDTTATVLACDGTRVYVLAATGRARGVAGWIDRHDVSKGANVGTPTHRGR